MIVLKKFFRRAKTLLWTAFSILVILAAVVVGIGKLLMPYSDRYQPRLEAWLSEEFGRPVLLESFEGKWTAFGPRLTLQGMKLLPAGLAGTDGYLDAGEAVAIESAALDVSPFNLLLPGRPLYNFRVIGADFELRRTIDNRFELSGFGVSDRGADSQGSALKELAKIGEVVLQDSSLVYQDEKFGILLGFSGIQGSLRLDGDELSTEIQAGFFDARSGLVYGDIEATLLLTLGEDQKMVSLDWQAAAGDLMLAAFQGRLPNTPFLPLSGWLNAELWGEWSASDGHRIKGAVDLSKARLVNEFQDLRIDHFNSRLRWQFEGKGKWNLHLADLLFDDGEQSWIAPRLSVTRDKAADLGLWISADELPLDLPLNLTRDIMSVYGKAWPAFLPGAASGKVDDLDLVLDSRWRVVMANGLITQASVTGSERWPDLGGLDAKVSLHRGSGMLELRGSQVDANWPRMFRDPIRFSIPACNLDLKWGGGWQIGFNDCRLENDDLAVQGDARISSDEGKPVVDINAAFTHGKIDKLDPYWPEPILKDSVKAWLRKGLVSGELVSARFQIHGDMDDWPFREGKGRFEAVARIKSGHLKYLDKWPDARDFQATVHFLGPSMELMGDIGDIGGVKAKSVRADIANLKSPVLKVDYLADTTLPQVLGFIEQTPLQELIKVDLSAFTFAGAARTEGALTVPLGKSAGDLALDGKFILPGGYFSDPVSEIMLEEISGELQYDEKGFSGKALDARFRGYPARLDLAAGTGQEEKFRADLKGLFGVRDVVPAFILESYAELAQFDGVCLWNASLVVSTSADADETQTLLTVESGLEGVDLDLPKPLAKPAGERWPLVFRYPFSGARQVLDVELVDRLTLRFDLTDHAESPLSSVIRLGKGLPDMPPEGFIRIEGGTEVFDLDGWIDVIIDGALGGRGMGGLLLEKGDIQAGEMLFLDRYFKNVGMGFSVIDTDVHGEFKAADIDGKVRFTQGETGPGSLSAEFERLSLGDPVSTGMDTQTNPADLPALHLYARSFRYSGVELGETRIEAYPTAKGFHFEKVDASSEKLSVHASGDWSLGELGQRSDFEIHMSSESLGDFLNSMDISSAVQGGQTMVDFSAWWPGSPGAFALSRLNGLIKFSVVDGNIADASAGTGRLLGLLSIQALPKRLSLDFRDVFDTGFSFDEAAGTFHLENGIAATDDMLLKSSVANISISGSTNLVEQQYDQLMTVRPGLGNTLPIIGVLAGGPIGAAAGLALQGLLQNQIGEATQVQYSITGSWEDPIFEAVDVERVEPTPPPPGN
jgi:uncharacterized protein (TIGR02099 family)